MNARLHSDFRARDDCAHLRDAGAVDGKLESEQRVGRHAGRPQHLGYALALLTRAVSECVLDNLGDRGFELLALEAGLARVERCRLSATAEPSAKEITQARPAFRRVSPSAFL